VNEEGWCNHDDDNNKWALLNGFGVSGGLLFTRGGWQY